MIFVLLVRAPFWNSTNEAPSENMLGITKESCIYQRSVGNPPKIKAINSKMHINCDSMELCKMVEHELLHRTNNKRSSSCFWVCDTESSHNCVFYSISESQEHI
jgi:hypothetical protein